MEDVNETNENYQRISYRLFSLRHHYAVLKNNCRF